VRGRIIDLSYKAAKEIDMIGPGTAYVKIAAMEKGRSGSESSQAAHANFHTGDFTVQVGAFVHKNLAERLRDKLGAFEAPVFLTTVSRDGRRFYRVRMGRYSSLANAEAAEARLIRNGYEKAFAVACDGS
jgi:rare lipoprotein A